LSGDAAASWTGRSATSRKPVAQESRTSRWRDTRPFGGRLLSLEGRWQRRAPAIYRPRHPERTALYRMFAQHFERVVQVSDERFAPRHGPLTQGAQEAVYRYLGCGILANGFARVLDRRLLAGPEGAHRDGVFAQLTGGGHAA